MTLRAAATIVLYAAILTAFAWFAITVDWNSLRHSSFAWGYLLSATASLLAFRYFGVFVWQVLLKRLKADSLPSFMILADIYSKAWLARYIPGTIPWIAGKILLTSKHGVSPGRLAVSSLVEAAAQIIAVGLVSLTLLAIDGRISEQSNVINTLVAIALLGLGIALTPPVFNRLLRVAFRFVSANPPPSVGWDILLASVGLYALGSVLSGIAYTLFAFSLIPEFAIADAIYLVGAFGLAGVVGMLTPFVPSGLGTRDGAQMLLLLVVLPPPLAALLVLATRAWSAATDVLFWIVATASRRLSPKLAHEIVT
jgi:hypothetical protein